MVRGRWGRCKRGMGREYVVDGEEAGRSGVVRGKLKEKQRGLIPLYSLPYTPYHSGMRYAYEYPIWFRYGIMRRERWLQHWKGETFARGSFPHYAGFVDKSVDKMLEDIGWV
jgi:hypothetical protein